MTIVFLLHDSNGVGTDGTIQSLENGIAEVLTVFLVEIVNEVHKHLGVCLTGEGVASADELLLQFLIVFNDTVVNENHLSAHGEVRVGICC